MRKFFLDIIDSTYQVEASASLWFERPPIFVGSGLATRNTAMANSPRAQSHGHIWLDINADIKNNISSITSQRCRRLTQHGVRVYKPIPEIAYCTSSVGTVVR